MTAASDATARPGRSSQARALALTWRAAWLEAWSNQPSFWSQIGLMVVNNVVFIVFWVVFFNRVENLHGWDLDRVLLLLAVLTTVVGIVVGLLHNVRRLSSLAADGELDAALALPVPTLAHLALRRVEPVSLGDLVTGFVLFFGFASPTPLRAAVFAFGVITGSMVLLGFFIIVGSIGFFAGRSDMSDTGLQTVVLFAHYPIDIFSGLARVLLYVVIPAGFVSAVPTRLVDEFEPQWAVAAVAAGLGFLTLGHLVFSVGLRRYTSGSVWTRS